MREENRPTGAPACHGHTSPTGSVWPMASLPPSPLPWHLRARMHHDGADFLYPGLLQVGAGGVQLLAAPLEVLLLKEGDLEA